MTVNALYPTVSPSLDLNFVRSGVLDSRVTFTRASTGTYFNSLGTLTTALTNVPRLDYNPSTLAAQGLLIEESRTNSIRNNTMVGAVAGTPGTAPTNWDIVVSGTGITQQIVGTGTEDGITYIDVKFSGTGSGSPAPQIRPETTTQIVAASGQTWSSSYYLRIVGGSTTGCTGTFQQVWQERDASGTTLNTVAVGIADPTTTDLKTQRSVLTRTLTDAGTARLTNRIQWVFTNGVAVDITLRIGLPQLEQGAFATSVIPTSTVAVTRSADVASVNTLTPWYNATESTLYTEFATSVPTSVTASAVVAGFDDGTANNRFGNFYTSNTSAVAASQVIAGAASFTLAVTGLTLSNVQKQATRYQAGSYASSVNGTAAVTDSFASAPPTVNTLRFGLRPSGTQANMYLRRITYFPVRLSNANLQAITT